MAECLYDLIILPLAIFSLTLTINAMTKGNPFMWLDKSKGDKGLFQPDRRSDNQASVALGTDRRTNPDRRKFLRPTARLQRLGAAVALVVFLLVALFSVLWP
jgi:hypothetical protein